MIELKPFSPIQNSVGLFADVHILSNQIDLKFELIDPKDLVLNAPSGLQQGLAKMSSLKSLSRAQGLWQSTCFEAFWRYPNEPHYWELNLSTLPNSLAWNLYRFDTYRHPQPPVENFEFSILEFSTLSSSSGGPRKIHCRMQSELPLKQLEISLAAVIQLKNKDISYWAAHHTSTQKPDFHHPDSFIIHRGSQ